MIKIYYMVWGEMRQSDEPFIFNALPKEGEIICIGDDKEYEVMDINWQKDEDGVFYPFMQLKER